MRNGGAPKHVLVADDDSATMGLLREILDEHGHRSSGVAAAEEVLDESRRLSPDLIVLDVVFGGEPHGLRVLERLRRDPTTAAIPVVLCTAAIGHVRTMEGRLAAQLAGVVLKPFDIDELLREIDAAWHRETRRGSEATAARNR